MLVSLTASLIDNPLREDYQPYTYCHSEKDGVEKEKRSKRNHVITYTLSKYLISRKIIEIQNSRLLYDISTQCTYLPYEVFYNSNTAFHGVL